MELEKILKLIDAGYTKADIDAMSVPAEPKQETPVEPEEPEVNPLLEEIKKLREALNLKNLHTDEKAPEIKESAEDILIALLQGKGEK